MELDVGSNHAVVGRVTFIGLYCDIFFHRMDTALKLHSHLPFFPIFLLYFNYHRMGAVEGRHGTAGSVLVQHDDKTHSGCRRFSKKKA